MNVPALLAVAAAISLPATTAAAGYFELRKGAAVQLRFRGSADRRIASASTLRGARKPSAEEALRPLAVRLRPGSRDPARAGGNRTGPRPMNIAIAKGLVALAAIVLPSTAPAADAIAPLVPGPIPFLRDDLRLVRSTVAGRASVVDGRTLWLPKRAQLVRLDGIDSCELPQWSYDPIQRGQSTIPKPVPCGPLAKAWLKRSLGNDRVFCSVVSYADDGALIGRCFASGRDLAIEMLRVGWARTTTPAPKHYLAWQDHAMDAGYGMWATYVLDMGEWRRKAIDRTMSRTPIADFHLLAERESEISPPFADARKRPKRVDR